MEESIPIQSDCRPILVIRTKPVGLIYISKNPNLTHNPNLTLDFIKKDKLEI